LPGIHVYDNAPLPTLIIPKVQRRKEIGAESKRKVYMEKLIVYLAYREKKSPPFSVLQWLVVKIFDASTVR